MIKRTREVLKFENVFVRLDDDEVVFANGMPGTYLRIEPAADVPGVVVVPVAQGHVALVRVYRYAVGRWQWELPRGFGQDPDPLVTARAELREEIGAEDADLVHLGRVAPDSGVQAARVEVFLAELPEPVDAPTDTLEVDQVAWVAIDDLFERVAAGEIEDGFTLSALMLARAKGAI